MRSGMKQGKSKFREYTEAIVLAIILALFIRAFVVQAFKIPSGSMIPTLLVGDHILVNKFIYGLKVPFYSKKIFPFEDPKRGDVIVFIYPEDPSKDFIKRVIGVGGDTIEIRNKKVLINGQEYEDPHAYYSNYSLAFAGGCPYCGPLKVPQNHLFVLGDNRDNSKDSRYWGFVPLESVRGKAFMIYWSNGSPHERALWNLPVRLYDAVNYNRWSRMGDIIR